MQRTARYFNEERLFEGFVSQIFEEPEMIDWMNWSDDQQEAQEF